MNKILSFYLCYFKYCFFVLKKEYYYYYNTHYIIRNLDLVVNIFRLVKYNDDDDDDDGSLFCIAVFVIFCSANLLRTFLYRADQLGMTSGGYVFLAMELFPSDWLGYYKLFYRGN